MKRSAGPNPPPKTVKPDFHPPGQNVSDVKRRAFKAGWDAAQRPQMSDTGAPVVVRGPDRTDFEEQFNRYRQKSNT